MSNFIGITILYVTVVVWGLSMMNTNSKESYFTMHDRHTRLGPAPKRAQDEQKPSANTAKNTGSADKTASVKGDGWSESTYM